MFEPNPEQRERSPKLHVVKPQETHQPGSEQLTNFNPDRLRQLDGPSAYMADFAKKYAYLAGSSLAIATLVVASYAMSRHKHHQARSGDEAPHAAVEAAINIPGESGKPYKYFDEVTISIADEHLNFRTAASLESNPVPRNRNILSINGASLYDETDQFPQTIVVHNAQVVAVKVNNKYQEFLVLPDSVYIDSVSAEQKKHTRTHDLFLFLGDATISPGYITPVGDPKPVQAIRGNIVVPKNGYAFNEVAPNYNQD